LPKETFEEMREKMLKSAKQGIKSAYSSEEYALIQAINAYLETTKSMNLMYERLTEWYGIYFPEIRMSSPKTLANLAVVMTEGKGASLERITEAIGDESKAKSVYEKAQSTIGRDMTENEKKALVRFAEMTNDTISAMEELEAYIKHASTKLMPNATYLTDEKIAAELLSKAGSLERLATMPASTVQLLGAEKALFKHIKFGTKPPKYGVLFKLPQIGSANREIRGRMARAYATKLCTALKADYFTKKFIAEQLKKSLDETVEKIRAAPPRPKPQGRPQQGSRPQWKGRDGGDRDRGRRGGYGRPGGGGDRHGPRRRF
jgi:nucleolar protein 56